MNAGARRPLASRGSRWAQAVSRRLAATALTPNAVSMIGVVAATLAGIALALGVREVGVVRAALLVLAALLCQLRLLCNLFDGMLAIEAGRSTPDGGVWNEVPDRFSDIAILVGCGIGIGAPALGWAAACAAVSTAYVREHGQAMDGVADFAGPMAKQQRMAVITLAAIVAGLVPLATGDAALADGALALALWAVALGAALTAVRRIVRLLARVNAG